MNQSMAIYAKNGQRLSHVRLRDFLRLKIEGRHLPGDVRPARALRRAERALVPRVPLERRGPDRSRRSRAARGVAQRGPDRAVERPSCSRSANRRSATTSRRRRTSRSASTRRASTSACGSFRAETAAFAKIVATPKAPLVAKRPKLGALTQFSNLSGVVASPQPAQRLDDGAEDGWAVASIEGRGADVRVWKITWNGNTPSLWSPTDVATDAFGEPSTRCRTAAR